MAEKRDYYEVLGVNKDASDEEIKRAYKQQVKKYHPDIYQGDKAYAENMMKEVNEAYDVLSTPEKKAKYDQFGHAGMDPNFGAGGFGGGGFGAGGFDFDLSDLFGSFFGGGGGRRSNGPQNGRDVESAVTLTFDEAVFGCEKSVDISRIEECDECHGSGAAAGTHPETCSVCHGTGRVTRRQQSIFGMTQVQSACDACRGTGKIVKNPCKKCGGNGRVRQRRKVNFKVPAGVDDNQVLTIGGQGDAGVRGGAAGSLNIVIRVKPHAVFKRNGYDIHIEVPITFVQAALGCELIVPVPDGKVKYTIPEGTQNDAVFRLKGKGVKKRNSSSYGDEYVHIRVIVPKSMNKKQKEAMKQVDAVLDDSNYQECNEFKRTFKNLYK